MGIIKKNKSCNSYVIKKMIRNRLETGCEVNKRYFLDIKNLHH